VASSAVIAGFAAWVAACGLRAGPAELGEVLGVLTACASEPGGVALDLRVDGQVRRFVVSEDDLPWPSEAYAALLKSKYVVSGGCPAPGEQLRIMECRRCSRPTTATIERGGNSSAFDESKRSLWVYRQFLNLERRRRDERTHEFLVSLVLARYNRADKKDRVLWIRDRLSNVLYAYSTAERAAEMVRRFGSPALESGIVPLGLVYRESLDHRGLVRGVPYLPPDPRASPFIGAWGVFPLEVHIEQGGLLSKAYELK
jgi:hypothetical protein